LLDIREGINVDFLKTKCYGVVRSHTQQLTQSRVKNALFFLMFTTLGSSTI